MTLALNGASVDLTEGATVLAVLSDKGIRPEAVVVELNGDILDRAAFADTRLKARDTMEIVHFVGGG